MFLTTLLLLFILFTKACTLLNIPDKQSFQEQSGIDSTIDSSRNELTPSEAVQRDTQGATT